jgi:hypothetical protein
MKETPQHWIICEDGTEYTDRFARFLPSFRYTRTTSARELFEALARQDASGILLDLDFRRTAANELIDEQGSTAADRTHAESVRLTREQGILILRQLRLRGYAIPVLLFADLDAPDRVRFLETQFGPLHVVASSDAIGDLALRMADFERK